MHAVSSQRDLPFTFLEEKTFFSGIFSLYFRFLDLHLENIFPSNHPCKQAYHPLHDTNNMKREILARKRHVLSFPEGPKEE